LVEPFIKVFQRATYGQIPSQIEQNVGSSALMLPKYKKNETLASKTSNDLKRRSDFPTISIQASLSGNRAGHP
jgi:hypothetical protein